MASVRHRRIFHAMAQGGTNAEKLCQSQRRAMKEYALVSSPFLHYVRRHVGAEVHDEPLPNVAGASQLAIHQECGKDTTDDLASGT